MAVTIVTIRLAIDVISPRHPDQHAPSVSTLMEDGSNLVRDLEAEVQLLSHLQGQATK